jgi:hypothetical protein
LATSVYQIRGHIKGKTLLPFPQVPDQGPHQRENTTLLPTGTRSGATSRGKHCSPSHRYQIEGHIKGKTLLPFPQLPDQGPHQREDTAPLLIRYQISRHIKGKTLLPYPQVPPGATSKRRKCSSSRRYQIRGNIVGKTLLLFP